MHRVPLAVSCLCGSHRQTVISRHSRNPMLLVSDLEQDRHGSGVLLVSHHPIEPPDEDQLSRLSVYYCGDNMTRFFCGTCGCHMFRSRIMYYPVSPAPSPLSTTAMAEADTPPAEEDMPSTEGDTPPTGPSKALITQQPTPPADDYESADDDESDDESDDECEEYFEVATGIIFMSPDTDEDVDYLAPHVVDADDGGLTPWLSIPALEGRTQVLAQSRIDPSSVGPIPAFCECGNIQMKIRRPHDVFSEEGVEYPYSPYPDLMCPFGRTPELRVRNPSNEPWYLSHDRTKYLAGTCACRSCRLITGYEIQTWAFIPRAAIQISATSSPRMSPFSPGYRPPSPDSFRPLDFKRLGNSPYNPLRSYESTEGISREFCACCGATVFWRGAMRPDLIDVSVGLLHTEEGSRAESLLQWWRGRCSFSEDTGMDRRGWSKDWSEDLIKRLERGMRSRA